MKSTLRDGLLLLVGGLGIVYGACSRQTGRVNNSRSFRMGVMASAPRPDITLYLQALTLWPLYSDAAIISTEVPWDSLLAGEDPIAFVVYNYQQLVSYDRSKNLKLWVYVDPENGLNRVSDSDELVALGKSIAQPAMQQVYTRFVAVMDSILHPDHLGLALETNAIRALAPDSIYQGVKTAAASAAALLGLYDPSVPLSVSIQAEVAWGKLAGTDFIGVSADFMDFPFLKELGISSYPYLSYATPGDLPDNYYARLVEDHPIPVFVSEGGWSSSPVTGFNGLPIQTSTAIQAAYIDRQGVLLSNANAIGVFQLTFTDLDLAGWPPADVAGLTPFAYLGLLDTNFSLKPAMAAWDSLLAKPVRNGN